MIKYQGVYGYTVVEGLLKADPLTTYS